MSTKFFFIATVIYAAGPALHVAASSSTSCLPNPLASPVSASQLPRGRSPSAGQDCLLVIIRVWLDQFSLPPYHDHLYTITFVIACRSLSALYPAHSFSPLHTGDSSDCWSIRHLHRIHTITTSAQPAYRIMQPLTMFKVPLDRRQINPAAFSGVTDQISNAGSVAGSKAADATSGLSRTQLSILIVCIIVGLVAGVAGLFWLCSCSRRRKRARETRERSELLQTDPSTREAATVPAFIAAPVDKPSSRPLGAYNSGWGESRVALNSSFVASKDERHGRDNGRLPYAQPSRPQPSQQSYRH